METKLVKINNMEDCKKDMEEAGRLIKEGELVAFPTETVYGLGGNGLFPAMPCLTLKLAMDFFALVITGLCPVIRAISSTADSMTLALSLASPRPIFIVTFSSLGTM